MLLSRVSSWFEGGFRLVSDWFQIELLVGKSFANGGFRKRSTCKWDNPL
jgi:hypothetical protein